MEQKVIIITSSYLNNRAVADLSDDLKPYLDEGWVIKSATPSAIGYCYQQGNSNVTKENYSVTILLERS